MRRECMKNIIFGASLTGEKFLFYHYKELEIEFYFDNFRQGEVFGYEVKKPYYNKEYFIIVATNTYLENRKQLLELGYEEFENFIPYQLFKKKMVVMYGNCHLYAVKQYLEQNAEFSKEYGFYPFPMIQDLEMDFQFKEIFLRCDLVLHQSIRKGNRYGEKYSSENILRLLPKNCQVISLPNLYSLPKCFFPQLDMDFELKCSFKYILGHDKNVINWIKQGASLEEIKGYIKENGGVYSKEEILLMWNDFRKKLLNREKEWDIKISDYIFENYRNKKLFYDPNHISDFLVREIASRTLKYLGYRTNIDGKGLILDVWETYIYKDVINALDLRFDQEFLRNNRQETLINKYCIKCDEYIENLYNWEKYFIKMQERIANKQRKE